MGHADYRQRLIDYVRAEARPVDKFSHQHRLYALANFLGQGTEFDDDVLYAGAWMHDIGVFIGHRPENLAELVVWDHIAYALRVTPEVLAQVGFPSSKVGAVLEIIRTHLPSGTPTSAEGVLLRDADILEQLGAVGMLRTISKVGRDTRFPTFEQALATIRRNATELPPLLALPEARRMAVPRLAVMAAFLQASEAEYGTTEP